MSSSKPTTTSERPQRPNVDRVFFFAKQHLKKSKQTEEDMLYGTAIQTPAKRRFLATATPNKTRKVGGALFVCKSVPDADAL